MCSIAVCSCHLWFIMIEKAKYSEMNDADFKIFSFQQRVSLHCGRFGHVLIIGCSLLTLWLSRLLSKLLILANRTQANTVITDLKYLFSRILISHKMFDILADLCNSRKTVPLGKKKSNYFNKLGGCHSHNHWEGVLSTLHFNTVWSCMISVLKHFTTTLQNKAIFYWYAFCLDFYWQKFKMDMPGRIGKDQR